MVNWKEVGWGLVLIIAAIVIVMDLSRKGSILRAVGQQLASIGIKDVVAGLLA